MRKKAGPEGFTAVEVMVTLVIAGLILAAGVPSFRNLIQTNDLQSGADEFAGRLRLARQAAVAEGVSYIVDWNDQDQTYTVGRDDNGDNQLQAGEIQSGPFSLPNSLTLENSQADGFSGSQVIFGPAGSASESGTVVLQNSNGITLNLTVLAPTGQVRVG
jgi:type IV fimbrial biogenesis protein FimT